MAGVQANESYNPDPNRNGNPDPDANPNPNSSVQSKMYIVTGSDHEMICAY